MNNLNDLWNRAAGEFPDRTAVIHADRAYTYAELDTLIHVFAAAARERLGVQPGDRVALVMPNCLHSIVCYLGLIRVGAIALPINIRLKATEMRFMFQDAAPVAVVAHESLRVTVEEALEGVEGVRERVLVPSAPHPRPLSLGRPRERGAREGAAAVVLLPSPERPHREGEGPGVRLSPSADWLPVDELLAPGAVRARAPQSEYPASPDDTAAIIYTSGTTGLPKGAMITHGNVLFNVTATIAGHGFVSEDIHLLIVPLFHVTGLNTIMPTAFHQGATLVVSADPSPSSLLEQIERHRCTTVFTVPTTTILLAQAPGLEGRDLSSLRLIAYSGAPMPVRAIQRLRELFPGKKLHNFFGLTETTSCTSVLPDEQVLVRPESIGRVVPGLAAKIVGDAGETLTPGEVGELLIKGPSIIKGYYNRPEATAEAIVDGWLHTGDTATLDAEGYLFLQGRKQEMIIVAGENVYPVEVENVLTRHPAVAEAAAIGEPHTIFGEVVKAVVVLRPGYEVTARDLKRHCTEHLAGFKVPQRFEFRESLPRNPSGKVVKRALRDEG